MNLSRIQLILRSLLLSILILSIVSSSTIIKRASNPDSDSDLVDPDTDTDQDQASSLPDDIDALIDSPSPSVKSLNSLTFDESVKNPSDPSAYLIEFFQPWCPHCQDFAPTWQDLCSINSHLEDGSKFYLRRINCEENGDLCAREGVRGYPHLALYFDGNFIQKYKGSRSFKTLNGYIRARLADYREYRAANLNLDSASKSS